MGAQWTVVGVQTYELLWYSHYVGKCHQPSWNDPLYRLSMLHIRLWANQKWQQSC